MLIQAPHSGNSEDGIDLSDDMGNPPPGFACPTCNRTDRAEKVSSVVRQGSGVILPSSGVREPQPYVTSLARTLSLPDPPRASNYPRTVASIVVSWVMGAIVVGAVALLKAQSLVDLPSLPLDAALYGTIVLFGLLLPLLLLWRTVLQQRAFRRQLPQWRHVRARWSRLYYCFRDDVVFYGGSDVAVSPDSVRSLLGGGDVPD